MHESVRHISEKEEHQRLRTLGVIKLSGALLLLLYLAVFVHLGPTAFARTIFGTSVPTDGRYVDPTWGYSIDLESDILTSQALDTDNGAVQVLRITEQSGNAAFLVAGLCRDLAEERYSPRTEDMLNPRDIAFPDASVAQLFEHNDSDGFVTRVAWLRRDSVCYQLSTDATDRGFLGRFLARFALTPTPPHQSTSPS